MNRRNAPVRLALLVALLAACSKSSPPNSPPGITSISVAPEVVAPGGTTTVAVAAYDGNGDPLGYTWTVPAGWTIQGASDGSTIAVTAPNTYGEVGIVRVQVSDGSGFASAVAVLRTSPAGAVQLRSLAAGPNPVRPGGSVRLEAVADSSGSGAIAYAWSVSDPAWTLTAAGASATLVAPYAYQQPATVTVTATDGASAPATGKVVVATVASAAPAIASFTATPAAVVPAGTVQLAADAVGAYGLGVSYAWSVASGAWTLTSAGGRAALVAPNVANAATTVTVTVTDAAGAASSSSLSVRTTDPTPIVSSISATPATVVPGRTSTLVASAASPAGRPLAYSWTASDPAWTLTGTGAIVTATAPLAYGRVAVVTVTADDGAGWSASATTLVASSAATAPVVTLLATPAAVPPGGSSQLSASAASPSGLPLSYAWSCSSPAWTITGSGPTVAIRAPAVALQTASVTVVVTDVAGAAASSTIGVSTLDSTPVFRSIAASPAPVAPGGTVTVTAAAVSPVGYAVAYGWSVSDPAWTLTGSGSSATLVAPSAYGRSATVTVTADDGRGGRAATSILVSTSAFQTPVVSLVATPSAAAPGGSVAVSATASSPSGLALTYLWSASAGWSVTGSGATATVIAPAATRASGTVTVTVSDTAGATAAATVPVATVDTTPTFRSLSAVPASVSPGGAVTLSAAVESPIGAPLTYTWTKSSARWAMTAGAGPTASLTAPMAYDDVVIVTVQATDPYGAHASGQVVVSTLALAAPSITSLDATPAIVDPGGRIALSAAGSSPAGLALSWSWTISGAGWAISGTGATATATAPLVRSSAAVATVTATDGAGATASRSVSLSTNDAPTTQVSAVIAGTAPLAGVVGRAVPLDASGSTSTGGGLLVFAWRVTSAPTGASASLVSSGAGDKASLTGDVPGLYAVEVAVTDAQGARAVATITVSLAGATTIQVFAGDGQSGAAGDDLAQPVVAVVRAASGATVPGVPVVWRIAGGRLLSSSGASDANGVVRASVRLGRIAAPGSVTVALRDAPTSVAAFGFVGRAGAPASLAVRAEPGTADTGVLVHVATVDAYGNESTDAASAASTFTLSVGSPSGRAAFGANVEGGVGVLVSGGGTTSIVGQLAAGKLDVRVTDPTAESVKLSLGRDPAATAPLPFSAWTQVLLDSGERGVASWTLASGVEPWRVVTGAKAASPLQGFGIELTGAEAIVPGASTMARSLGALAFPMVRLDLVQQASVTSATDAAARCTAQPALTIAMRNGSGAESPVRPAPVAGWPVQDPCDGRAGFATTTGFVPAVLDLTDATQAGYTSLSLELSSAPGPATPAAPVAWYVDDVIVQALVPAAWTAASTSALVRPGAPAAVTLSSGSSFPVLYRQCVTGYPALDVVVSVVDANGNLAADAVHAFGVAWTGSAALASIQAGSATALGSATVTVKVDGGRAVLRFADAVAESLTFSLSDPAATGLTLGPNLAISTPYGCHSTGNGYNWSDTVPVGTITVAQAIRACETSYGAGGCTYSSGTVQPNGYSGSCGVFWRWTVTGGFSSNCGSAGAATATNGYWSTYGTYSCGWGWTCYYCAGGCGSEGWQQFRPVSGSTPWN